MHACNPFGFASRGRRTAIERLLAQRAKAAYLRPIQTFPTLRVARPSDNLDAVLPFYRDGLGLAVLYRFQDHDGFDGVLLGAANAPYHFEFTRAHGQTAGKAPTADNLLVFYLQNEAQWLAAVERMRAVGFEPVAAFNPYWDRDGLTFEDPDGYRVVLQRGHWEAWPSAAQVGVSKERRDRWLTWAA